MMIRQLFAKSRLQSRFRIASLILLVVGGLIGLYYLGGAGRDVWRDSLSLEDLKAEGAKHPDDGELNVILAHRLAKDGRDMEAFTVVQHLAEKYPNNELYWMRAADYARNMGHATEVVNAYNRVLALNPKRADVYIELGRIYGQAEMPTEALENFERGTKLDPTVSANHLIWVDCLVKKGRLQEAWDQVMRVLETDRLMEDLYGYVYIAGVPLGKSKEAEDFLFSRMHLFADYHGSAAKSALARLMVAEKQDEKTLGIAEMMAEESVKGQGASPDDNAALGEIRLLKNDLKGARSTLEAGLKRYPIGQPCLKALIQVAKREGHKEEVESLQMRLTASEEGVPEVAARRKAVRAAPNDPQAHLALAAALEKTGDFGAATEECHEALRIAPKDPTAAAQLDRDRLAALQKLTKKTTESLTP